VLFTMFSLRNFFFEFWGNDSLWYHIIFFCILRFIYFLIFMFVFKGRGSITHFFLGRSGSWETSVIIILIIFLFIITRGFLFTIWEGNWLTSWSIRVSIIMIFLHWLFLMHLLFSHWRWLFLPIIRRIILFLLCIRMYIRFKRMTFFLLDTRWNITIKFTLLFILSCNLNG